VLEFLKAADQKIFLFLNGMHNSFFDFIMYWASNRFIWIPFYAILLILVIRTFRTKTYFILFLVASMITTSDQVSSSLVKNYIQRLRPCHNPDLEGQVHLLRGECGGSFGFFSSHASNSCALAIFLILVFRRKKINPDSDLQTKVVYAILMVYALLVSYSRIYLGTHYPGDVLTGMAFGTLLSFIFANIFFRYGGIKNKPMV
jgi:undecaprenyl-diphosphatase